MLSERTRNREHRERILQRYPFVVYLVVASLGLILVLIAFIANPAILAEALLSFGTGLFGAAAILLLLRAFLLDQNDTAADVSELIAQIQRNQSTTFIWRRDAAISETAERFRGARTADFCGYTLDRLVAELGNQIASSLAGGSEIRVLVVDGTGPAHTLMKERSVAPSATHNVCYTSEALRKVAENVRALGTEPNLEVRSTGWIPSCSMYILDRDHPSSKSGWMQVEVYPPSYGTAPGDRLTFTIDSVREAEWFDYFTDQFERLWDGGQRIDLDLPASSSRPANDTVRKQ